MARTIISSSILLFVLGLLHVQTVSCVVRTYFIAAQEIEWDYAETKQNLANTDQQNYADMYLEPGNDRIGGKYKKVTYFEYTDDTFTTEIPKAPYLGILGPIIRAEVGDAINITYFNNASGTFSVHPHGSFYLKNHEGALYLDKTSGEDKNDDLVQPGQTVKLIWNVTDNDAPGENDPNCIPWVYHSHVNTVKDTSAGLVGPLITCKKGILDDNNERTDVSVEYPLLMKIYDENISWLVDKNIDTYCKDPVQCHKLLDAHDDDFFESNYMHSINGKMFGHLTGLEACVGDKVAFYVIGMGNEFDVHSLFFQGQNLNYQHTRGDTVSVFTATFVAAETTPTRAGTWTLSDMVDGKARAGMSVFYKTKECSHKSMHDSQPEVVREYFLSAEEVEWDYGPGGKDLYLNKNLTENDSHSKYFFDKSDTRIGGVYKKARFFQYANDSYTVKIKCLGVDDHIGILGPVVKAEVGDTINVTLKNDVAFPISFLPHGLSFDYREMGSGLGTKKSIQPGTQHTYTFKVPQNMLNETDDDCINFIYTSAIDFTKDHNTGLVGPILICRKGHSHSQSKSKRFFIFFTAFDENESMYLDENIKTYLPSSTDVEKSDEDFKASNIIYTINGLSFANLPGISVCLDSHVTWYTMALGTDTDVHTLKFDGNVFESEGKHRNIQQLVAGSNAVLQMKPDNEGSWLLQSMTNDASNGGAYALYDVTKCGPYPLPESFSKVKIYHIAAEEVDWDYSPLTRSLIDGADLNDPKESGYIFITRKENMIGNVYRKVIYKEYQDSSFTREKVRDVSERHMGILGPAIRAEVGDVVIVHFMNKASRPYSMHPHGLKYNHKNAGKTYGGNKADVLPGNSQVYTWYVPSRSGPGPSDPDCIPWMYYSAVDQDKDTSSGLMGPIVICRSGILDRYGERKDKHRELFVLMSIMNENDSWYLEENLKKYAPKRIGTDYANDPEFDESNMMHAINGRLFGNNKDLIAEYNTTVDWYLMVMGSTEDLHTIHTHGHTFMHNSESHRDDVIAMFPGMAETVQMKTDNPGTWLMHCHTLDHIGAGMETTYTVLKPGESIPTDENPTDEVVG